MASPVVDETHDLELLSIIGFDGRTIHGLKVHPDGIHVLYPLGSKIAIVKWETRQQDFLEGHTNVITAVALSPDGRYVGSGQINHMGFKALVILWDFEKRTALMKHDVHKVRVESLDFSCDSMYLFSLGGRDDGNVVVTHIPSLEPMCGYAATRATAGNALTLKHTNLRSSTFMSAGEDTLRLWRLNPEQRNVRAIDVRLNKIKRNILCVSIDSKDEFAYCGTQTGDILKVALYFGNDIDNLEPKRTPNMTLCLGKIPSKKRSTEAERYSQGVQDILIIEKEAQSYLIVGAGDGTVEMVVEKSGGFKDKNRLKIPSYPLLAVIQKSFVDSAVTALQLFRNEIMVGTAMCEIYLLDISTFSARLLVTCHTTCIYDVAFPKNYSEVFATASKDDVRVWNTETCKELLRICVPNFTCSAVKFSADGKSIITGWNDGCIRAFTPQSGKLIYTIPNAHSKGVTALDVTSDGITIVTGGGEGQVRVWKVKPTSHKLAEILKDHKGPVSDIHISYNNLQAVSASTDGSCIIWDIVRLVRLQILFANSLFMACRYNPSGCQVLTAGTDRKVQYWECYDGSLIRDLEGSTAAALNSLDISQDGQYFVTGSNDYLVKVWDYNEGYTTHIGIGHAGIITAVRFSPDNRYLISVSDDGAIFTWKCPFQSQKEDSKVAAETSIEELEECNEAQVDDRSKMISKTERPPSNLDVGAGDFASESKGLPTNRSEDCVGQTPTQPIQSSIIEKTGVLAKDCRRTTATSGSRSATTVDKKSIPPIDKFIHRKEKCSVSEPHVFKSKNINESVSRSGCFKPAKQKRRP